MKTRNKIRNIKPKFSRSTESKNQKNKKQEKYGKNPGFFFKNSIYINI
jgi:hypothetical protein